MWNDVAIQELLLLLRGTNAVLSEIHHAIERLALATEKKPPSSKRGGR
jgi:hypothetical protein